MQRSKRTRARPAFLVTFSVASVAGCAKDAPIEQHTHNPPAIPDHPQPSAAPRSDDKVTRNPSAQGSEVRLASNGTCFVYKPFGPLLPGELRPPGTEPPRAVVECPAGFADDPAYKDCIDGVVLATADSADCLCAIGGNPPPLPRPVVCPK